MILKGNFHVKFGQAECMISPFYSQLYLNPNTKLQEKSVTMRGVKWK